MRSPLDDAESDIRRWVELGHSNAHIVRELANQWSIDTSESAVRRAKKRWGLNGVSQPLTVEETAGAHIEADRATITSRPSTADITPEELMEQKGLDPNDWTYQATVNCWDALVGNGEYTTLHQLKIVCKRKPEAIVRDLTIKNSWVPPKPNKKRVAAKAVSHHVILPDPHAPHHEVALVEASVALIETLQPAKILCLGDLKDNCPWSRHKPNPRMDICAEEALWAGYEMLAGWRAAAPDAEFDICWGNHDFWIMDRLKETYPELVTLRRPGEEEPYLSLSKLLRLEDLRINCIETVGEYHDVTLQLHDDLVAMHGTKAGKHGGAILEIDGWEGASIIQGHDHKTAIIAVNKRLPNGGHTQRYAISAGTMARRDLGYDPKQNVSQSFVVITEYEDGRWHPELALYDPVRKDTTYRDWRYTG